MKRHAVIILLAALFLAGAHPRPEDSTPSPGEGSGPVLMRGSFLVDLRHRFALNFALNYTELGIKYVAPSADERFGVEAEGLNIAIYPFDALSAGSVTSDKFLKLAFRNLWAKSPDAEIRQFLKAFAPVLKKNASAGTSRSPEHTWIMVPGKPEDRYQKFIFVFRGPGKGVIAIAGVDLEVEAAWQSLITNIKSLRFFDAKAYTIDSKGVYKDKELGFSFVIPKETIVYHGFEPPRVMYYFPAKMGKDFYTGRIYVLSNPPKTTDRELMEDIIRRPDLLPIQPGGVEGNTEPAMVKAVRFKGTGAGLRYVYNSSIAASYDLFRRGNRAYLIEIFYTKTEGLTAEKMNENADNAAKGLRIR